VKNRLALLSFVATVAAVFALGCWVLTSWNSNSLGTVAQAQQTTPNSQTPAEPPAQNQAPQQAQPPAQSGQTPPGQASDSPSDGHEFVGTIVKQGAKYMFQDSGTGQMYDIDHQDEVKKFDGKRVRVRGTLDPQTKTIHVQ
jgi:guanyl-specific ribonuclease Sa